MSLKRLISVLLVLCTVFAFAVPANAATYWETESNNAYSTANIINVNNSVQGNIKDAYDEDYFKIVSPADGKLTLKFCHNYRNSSAWWIVNVYRYIDGSVYQLSTTQVYVSGDNVISLPDIGAVKNGVYYIRVVGLYSINMSGDTYKIVTSLTQTPHYEKEFNNDRYSATQAYFNKSVSGNINISGDEDYYRITAPANGKFTVKFSHAVSSVTKRWYVHIYKLENGSLQSLDYRVIYLNENKTVTFNNVNTVRGMDYYVCVSADYDTAIVGKNYTITVSYSTPAIQPPTKISVSNKTSNSLTLSWNTCKNATGYRVYRYTSSGWKAITTTTKTYCELINMTPGAKYIFAVKPYMKYQYGHLWASTFTKVSTVTKLDTPYSATVTSAGTGKARVQWGDISGESGYQIWYTTNPANGYKKINNYKANTYWVEYKNLTRGATYYFKVRAYKSLGNGKYVYSPFTPAKSIYVR